LFVAINVVLKTFELENSKILDSCGTKSRYDRLGSAKAFGTKRIPSRKIPKNTGKIIFLVIFYFD